MQQINFYQYPNVAVTSSEVLFYLELLYMGVQYQVWPSYDSYIVMTTFKIFKQLIKSKETSSQLSVFLLEKMIDLGQISIIGRDFIPTK